MKRPAWLGAMAAPLAGWLGERATTPPPLAGAPPPAPLFGLRFKPSPHPPASSPTPADPATRAVEHAHGLALAFAELGAKERRSRALPLAAALRDLARSKSTSPSAATLFRPALALAWGGKLFEGDEPRRWNQEAAARWTAALERGVARDGVVLGAGVREHIEALSDALEFRALLADDRALARYDERLEPLVQAAADLRTPGRRTVDTPGAPQCLAAWHRMTGKRPAARETFALETSGLYGVRAERSLALIDTGASGRRSSWGLEWTVDGRRILVAEGVEQDEAKTCGTRLVLDGRGPRRARAPRVERTRLERLDHTLVLETIHHGYAALRGRPVHNRRVTASAHGLAVEDQVAGGSGQPVFGELVLDPQVEVRRRGRSWVLVAGRVTALLESRAEVDFEPAWWLGEDGEWHSTLRLVLRYGVAPCGGSFRLDRLLPRSTVTSLLRRESLSLDPSQGEARASA